METLPTDKTHAIVLKGGVKLWITKDQCENAKNAIMAGKEFCEVGGSLFATAAVLLIAPATEVEEADKIKRGEYKCAYNEWHERGEGCGHGDEKKLSFPGK